MTGQIKTIGAVMVAIAGTGLILNLAGSGKLGPQLQSVAQSITEGYGV